MNPLKKIISLNQAAQISGYTQDYLGYLIRKGEIKGTKKGKAWFTTEEEINNYLFKKKVLRKDLAIKEFFSPTRRKNIIRFTIILILISIVLILFFSDLNKNQIQNQIQSAEISDGASLNVPNKK